jgi:tape measure domain-containing protein
LRDIRGAAGNTGKAIGKMDRRMKAASQTAAVFRRALTGLGAGLLVREFVRLSDSFTNTTNRLKLVTEGTFELKAVQEELFTLFNRLALSAKDLGVSLDDVLSVTKSLNQAVILSGAATTEASAGLIQLSQGVASNRLSGDELRSVLEQLPVVADVIAKQLGVTRGELKFFGEAGKISADTIFKAFANAREELESRFAETVPTVAQSFTILRNAAIRFVGTLNESTGLITIVSRFIIKLAQNFDVLAKAAGVAAVALGPLVLGRAVLIATTALRGLFFLLVRNPFTVLIVGIAAATQAIIAFGDVPLGDIAKDGADGFAATAANALGLTAAIEDGLIPAQTTWGDVARGTLQAAIMWTKDTARFFVDAWKTAFDKLLGFFGVANQSWGDIFTTAKAVLNKVIGLFVGFANAVQFIFTGALGRTQELLGTLFYVFEPILLSIRDLAAQVFNTLRGWAEALFGFISESATDIATEIGLDEIDFKDNAVVKDAMAFGEGVSAAFLEGFDTDYIGAVGNFLLPAFDRVLEETGVIAEKRLKDAEARLAGEAGVDLSKKTDAKIIIRPEDARLLAKLVKETLTPLEKFQARAEEIARLRVFAKTTQEVEGLDRALKQAGLDRISEEFALLGLDKLPKVMEEAVPAVERYNMALEGLNTLLKDGVINQQQFDAAVKNAGDKILGLKDLYAEFAKSAAESIQSAFSDFLFDPFENGLDGMIKGMSDTLRRIAADILSTQILKSLFSLIPGGGAIAGLLAEGGPAQAGKSYIVGEQGPEIFTPQTSGMVTPNGEAPPSQAAPSVNVAGPTIINTIEDSAIVAAFNRGGGGEVVLNNMTENKAAYRNALGL